MKAPSKRLGAIASLVREGSFVADVGTDHAFLPIFLLESGKARAAVASDIVKGPLERAKEHIAASGLQDKIACELCPGLDNIEKYDPDDIIIAGMGGELIASIIRNAPMCMDIERKRNLLLQPMTKAYDLRLFLSQNGFMINEEIAVYEDKRIYCVISSSYTAKPYHLSDLEMLVGPIIIKKALAGDSLCAQIIKNEEEHLNKIIASRKGTQKDSETEENARSEALKYLEEIRNNT